MTDYFFLNTIVTVIFSGINKTFPEVSHRSIENSLFVSIMSKLYFETIYSAISF